MSSAFSRSRPALLFMTITASYLMIQNARSDYAHHSGCLTPAAQTLPYMENQKISRIQLKFGEKRGKVSIYVEIIVNSIYRIVEGDSIVYQIDPEIYKALLNADSISEAMGHLKNLSMGSLGCEHLYIMLSDGNQRNGMALTDSVNIDESTAEQINTIEQNTQFFSSRFIDSQYYGVTTDDENFHEVPSTVQSLLQSSGFSSMYIFDLQNHLANGILVFFFGNAVSLTPVEIEKCLVLSIHMKQLVEKIVFRKQFIKKQIYENLFNTLRLKDTYTVNHSYNVAFYASLLGEKIGLDAEELKILKIGALLHDIGKIGVPDKILRKPGPLTEEEYEFVKRHPLIGYKLLKDFPDVEHILPIVKWHHERIDGLGYPERLHGDQIPYMVRIVTIADAFDAMTSQRVYRNNLTMDEAQKQLLKNAGLQFDGDMVCKFLEIVDGQKKLYSSNKRV
ncbi:HD-GYP domain-containing protein [Ferviditalea candida]|uniref:HD-GYP domain-containing protein n=1 Tax=Ferviditalea candida TaxID=3108399 RepID=A0ABU5ZDM1_9BACL|nr:HD-GYP domain-containing protein [Paenibacillaceae bacterium T2]